MNEVGEVDIQDLLFKTTCATVLGIAGAEVFRATFNQWFSGRATSSAPYLNLLHDCIHSAISAFILIVVSYEKALFLRAGMEGTFYIFTFFLGIVFARIFASAFPSPCYPLALNWNRIRQAGYALDSKKKQIKSSFNLISFFRMAFTYLRVAIPFILGQALGLLVAVKWLKTYWNLDGWVSAHHITNLPLLDECIPCLNTSVGQGFAIEASLTFIFLIIFQFVDNLMLSRDGAGESVSYILKTSFKSAMIVIVLYIFMSITGAFSNPFHALSMQRNCMTDYIVASKILFVYVIGPFVGTIAFMLFNEKDEKAKHSV